MRAHLFAIGLLAALWAPVASAAELLMFEERWCIYCERWKVEVGPIYPKSAEGRRAPLRTIDIHGDYPEDVKLASRPQFSPTFVLVEDGQEVGRIEGYPGEDFFWGLLGRLIERLPPAPPGEG